MIILWELIIILVTIIFIAYIVNKIEATKKEINSRMSFKEALDLIELPIVTFYQGDKKLNFMLDSGSNLSIILFSALLNLTYSLLVFSKYLLSSTCINLESTSLYLDSNFITSCFIILLL